MNSDNENKKVNDLTLQYFSNKNYTNSVNQKLNKNQNNKIENDKKINSKEIKFYRKRIMDFTKKMLRNLLSTKIPKNQIDRDKTGFTFPIQEWLDVENINYPNILNKNKIEIMKKDHISGKTEFRNFFYSMNALNL